jgi:hypothetical protein
MTEELEFETQKGKEFLLLQIIQRPLLFHGQSSWLQTKSYRVRFPALPDFLSSTLSGTGSTLLVSINEELFKRKIIGSRLENWD